MNKNITLKPVALIGQYESSGKFYPAANILNEKENVSFDAEFVAASAICLYEAFLSHVPENIQNEFESSFAASFLLFFKQKELLVEKADLKNKL